MPGSHPAPTPPHGAAVPARRAPGSAETTTRQVGGRSYDRVTLCTPWLAPGTDLGAVLRDLVGPLARPGDLVAISEKVVVVATGRGIPASSVVPGPLARFVARQVRPIGDSRGLSIPEKVQYVIDRLGRARVVAAVVAGAVTRPFGVRGAFYVVAGPLATGIDGLRPPYEDTLLPPLERAEARAVAEQLAAAVGHPVAIVDINDRGGRVRYVPPGAEPAGGLLAVLGDNPMGQRDQATPVVLVRPSAAGAGATAPTPRASAWSARRRERLAGRLRQARARGPVDGAERGEVQRTAGCA